jgi:multidrug efflux system membrane fusion protein
LTTVVSLDPIHFVFDASEADYIHYAPLVSRWKARTVEGCPPSGHGPAPDEPDWSHGRSGTMNFVDNQLNRSAAGHSSRTKICS